MRPTPSHSSPALNKHFKLHAATDELLAQLAAGKNQGSVGNGSNRLESDDAQFVAVLSSITLFCGRVPCISVISESISSPRRIAAMR